MKNENIRKALALAIDRQGLIDNITKGEQQPAMGIVPNSVEGFGDDEGYFKDADFDEAKKYLEAGLKELGGRDIEDTSLEQSGSLQASSQIAFAILLILI